MNYVKELSSTKDCAAPPRIITRESELANRVNQEMIESSYSISEMTEFVITVRQFVIDQLADQQVRAEFKISEAKDCAAKLGLK
jgi:phosphatidate phosphatase APP1